MTKPVQRSESHMDSFDKEILKELRDDKLPVEDPGGTVDLKVDYDLPDVPSGSRTQLDEALIQNLVSRDANLTEPLFTPTEQIPEPTGRGKPRNLPEDVPLIHFKRRIPAVDSDSAIEIATRKSGVQVKVLDSDRGRYYQFESNQEARDTAALLNDYGIDVELLETRDKKTAAYEKEFKTAYGNVKAANKRVGSKFAEIQKAFNSYIGYVANYDEKIYPIDDKMRLILDEMGSIVGAAERVEDRMKNLIDMLATMKDDFDSEAGY